MTFERFLAMHRHRKVEFARAKAKNPTRAADEFAQELNAHLATVKDWINHGGSNRAKMLGTMEFFRRYFGNVYQAKVGTLIFRGQGGRQFDGSPRSYSTDPSVATWFACSTANRVVIERRVCHSCSDRPAFRLTLDLGALLAKYGTHKYGFEKEVVILNTMPKGATTFISEVISCQ
jgi:hypothetical protein